MPGRLYRLQRLHTKIACQITRFDGEAVYDADLVNEQIKIRITCFSDVWNISQHQQRVMILYALLPNNVLRHYVIKGNFLFS